MEKAGTDEPVLWKSALAIFVLFIVWSVVSSLVSIVSSVANVVFNNYSEEMADFWGQLTGGALGILAARMLLDKWLKPYSGHALFLMVVILAVGALAIEHYTFDMPWAAWRMIVYGANGVGSIGCAYMCFWKNEQILP